MSDVPRGRSLTRRMKETGDVLSDASESLQTSVKGFIKSSSDSGQQIAGMLKSSSGQFLSGMHQESKWETEGGWRPSSQDRRQEHKMERDASMVQLLNLLDPQSLVDQRSLQSPVLARMPSITDFEQHSALSLRGIAFVGGASAFAWYILRLLIRERLGMAPSKKRDLLELHALSSLHAVAWVFFLIKKLRSPAGEISQYCSRALVGALGFYIHDCLAVSGTVLRDPSMFTHQASVAVTIASILRSKGVAWLAPPLMSLAVPTLVQEVLQFCGTLGLPATRPEVRSLRLLWFASFAASKFALLPLWLKFRDSADLNQPNLLVGKISYMLGVVLNLRFMALAAYNLPRFLAPAGAVVAAKEAYRIPLRQAAKMGTALTTGVLLSAAFGSYLVAPIAAILALLSFRGNASKRLRIIASLSCGVVALDKLLPMPSQSAVDSLPWRLLLPFARLIPKSFNHRFYVQNSIEDTFKKDRSYLLAVAPHGFFPWGVAMILLDLLEHGYLPNFVGASVVGTLPIAGRIVRAFGYRPATVSEITSCLKKPYPRNVTIIVPGGIAEMFTIREDIEISMASVRKGFVDLAVKNGAVLVPGYMFGNSKLYEVAQGAVGDFFKWISRELQMSMNLFSGRWGTLLPYPHQLACAIGKPIDTREFTNVDTVHNLFCKNLRDAYHEHRSDFGWAGRELYFEGEDMPPPPVDPLAYNALPNLSKL